MFDKFKRDQEVNKIVVERLNDEIVNKAFSADSNAKEIFELWQNKQTVKTGGFINPSDVTKIVANVVIVVAIMAFETRYVINKTATKFIQPLK